jgi:hypothetical protein
MIRRKTSVVLLAFGMVVAASSARAQGSWGGAVSGMGGGSLPLAVNGLRISDPSVPMDLRSDGGVNKKAGVIGGRVSIFRRVERGIEWGGLFDVRTFRYDGKAGVETRVTGTVAGSPVNDIEISAGDETRVTMMMAALVARMPLGRTPDMPGGRWTPYVAVGGGNQHARIKADTSFTTDAPTGLLLGSVEVAVSPRIGIFGEYRYEHLRDEVTMDTTTVKIKLRTNHIAGGITFHF